MKNNPPLYDFIKARNSVENIMFKDYEGFPFIVGQQVRGTWVDDDGRTSYCEGTIIYYEKTGYWVETSDGGITPVKAFWTMYFNEQDL